MTKDLRSRNEYFSTESVSTYFSQYSAKLKDALDTVLYASLELASLILEKTKGRIFVAGNGGSASIADHLVCDFTKGIDCAHQKAFNVHSLVGSLSLFTALANDEGYENTFKRQLEMANLNIDDSVILISSSGNSANIIAAASYALGRAPCIGLTGFDGGHLKDLCEVSLHVDAHNYGIVEDSHQIIMHVLAQFEYAKHV